MAFLTEQEIHKIGFKSVGKDVLISDKAVFYRPERISIGNHVRIDDFAVLANNIILHDHIHITLKSSLLSSDNSVIELEDYTGVGYHSIIFTETDDFSGGALINPTVPSTFRNLKSKSVHLYKYSTIGAGSLVMPGADLLEGATLGAGSVLMQPSKPWMCYFGVPARAVAKRNEIAKEKAEDIVDNDKKK